MPLLCTCPYCVHVSTPCQLPLCACPHCAHVPTECVTLLCMSSHSMYAPAVHMPYYVFAPPGLYICPHCAQTPVFVVRPWACLLLLCTPHSQGLVFLYTKRLRAVRLTAGPSMSWAISVEGAQQPASPQQPTTGKLFCDGPSSGGPRACLLPGRGLPFSFPNCTQKETPRAPSVGDTRRQAAELEPREFHRYLLAVRPHPFWGS